MDDQPLTAFDHLTMHKDAVQIYPVSRMKVEHYQDGDLQQALFPIRQQTTRDIAELKQLQQLAQEEEAVLQQLSKMDAALQQIHADSEWEAELQLNPEKNKKLLDIEQYHQQLASKQQEIEGERQALLSRCMQYFVQYITIVPDHAITSWRYDKGYILVFLNGEPEYFNADSDKVTFSDIWQSGHTATVRGKINDAHRKIHLEFIVIWRNNNV